VTSELLTAVLAKRVMGRGVAPGRFLTGNRGWMPRWRFQPTEKLPDALRLLEKAAPEEYNMRGDGEGNVQVHVRIGDASGEACGASKPRASTWAIARALGIEVDQ
jgi:hypothetical protein